MLDNPQLVVEEVDLFAAEEHAERLTLQERDLEPVGARPDAIGARGLERQVADSDVVAVGRVEVMVGGVPVEQDELELVANQGGDLPFTVEVGAEDLAVVRVRDVEGVEHDPHAARRCRGRHCPRDLNREAEAVELAGRFRERAAAARACEVDVDVIAVDATLCRLRYHDAAWVVDGYVRHATDVVLARAAREVATVGDQLVDQGGAGWTRGRGRDEEVIVLVEQGLVPVAVGAGGQQPETGQLLARLSTVAGSPDVSPRRLQRNCSEVRRDRGPRGVKPLLGGGDVDPAWTRTRDRSSGRRVRPSGLGRVAQAHDHARGMNLGADAVLPVGAVKDERTLDVDPVAPLRHSPVGDRPLLDLELDPASLVRLALGEVAGRDFRLEPGVGEDEDVAVDRVVVDRVVLGRNL